RDIQTSGFSVNPNYVYSDARDANGYQLPPKINGYQVFNTVNVRIRKLDTLGAVLDKAVTVGSNTINGVTFSVSDTADILDEARKQALADARKKAELYATAAGVELGDLRAISETQNMGGPIPYAAADLAYARAEKAPVPVEGGELTYTINVSVTWALDQAN
ncbi:MAG: DUF541 domain-containing protein, partial [Hyphomicrobiales bacterium]